MGDFYNGYNNGMGSLYHQQTYNRPYTERRHKYVPGYDEHIEDKYKLTNYSYTAREVSLFIVGCMQ